MRTSLDETLNKNQLLSIYFTAGYPKLDDTGVILNSLAASGVDLVEIGMPYSDPVADGPTIQESNQLALENGITISKLFEQLDGIRSKIEIPIILMGYLNPIMQYGIERFCKQCQAIGIDGLIIPDLPLFEYEAEYKRTFDDYGLKNIFLITPQTKEERIRQIDSISDSFIYMVSSSAITGAKGDIDKSQKEYFTRINGMDLKNPRLIGFGISNTQTFAEACEYSNGAIIGSAFIKMLSSSTHLEKDIPLFVKEIRGAVK
ncbi:MAG: tryptophan synthase subunit alpha [Cyclobacteriaceae bacterium]